MHFFGSVHCCVCVRAPRRTHGAPATHSHTHNRESFYDCCRFCGCRFFFSADVDGYPILAIRSTQLFCRLCRDVCAYFVHGANAQCSFPTELFMFAIMWSIADIANFHIAVCCFFYGSCERTFLAEGRRWPAPHFRLITVLADMLAVWAIFVCPYGECWAIP